VISTDVSDSGSIPLNSTFGVVMVSTGHKEVTEAGSVRAKTQTLTKSLVSPVKQHQLLLDPKGDGVISALSTK